MEDDGTITFADTVSQTGSGRPSEVFALRSDAFHGVGVYLEPDRVVAVLMDAGKTVLGEWYRNLENGPRGKDEVQDLLRDVTGWALENAREQVHAPAITSVGLAVPGFVDTMHAHWTAGLQFGDFSDVDVASVLSEVTDAEVSLEDTSRSLTHLELMTGPSSVASDYFIVVNMGLGLGAGIVVDGNVLLGHGGIVGEIGHIPLGNNSNRCSCGNLGCTETMLSASGIRSEFARRLRHGVRSSIRPSGPESLPSIRDILHSAERGDHFTVSTLAELGSMMGDLLDIVLKSHTPCPVVLAGEGALLADHMVPAMQQRLAMRMLPEMQRHFSIGIQEYTGANEASGAALLGLSRMLSTAWSQA
jgi:predicted NBD/HSP70 family sugar kinase